MASVGDLVRLSIERIVPGGDGLGHHDGLAVFVPMTAPGDELVARVDQVKPGYLRCEMVELLSPGPGRVDPACPLYGECGGCNLMHLTYKAQLEAKQDIVLEAWRRSGGIDLEDVDIVASAPWAYRNRAQFHVAPTGGAGYARRSSRSLLAVDSCPVLVPALERWLGCALAGTRALPQGAELKRFVAFGHGDSVYIEGIDSEVELQIHGKQLRFGVGGFFQSNIAMVEKLLPEVCGGHRYGLAADLYCGAGLFASFLKDTCTKLVCVEEDKRSIGYACANVGRSASFSAMSLEQWIRTDQAQERFDSVVLDPPRAGLSAAVRSWLAAARPRRIDYVSCDPVSLARDAAALVRAGYILDRLSVYDFYPQTSHVESHARFLLG